jgi:hypothetical protein
MGVFIPVDKLRACYHVDSSLFPLFCCPVVLLFCFRAVYLMSLLTRILLFTFLMALVGGGSTEKDCLVLMADVEQHFFKPNAVIWPFLWKKKRYW